jgi:hypothetical protein
MLRSPVSWIVVAILLLATRVPAADEAAPRVKVEPADAPAAEEPESAAAAEQRRLIEEFQKAEAMERGNLAAVREHAAFREVRSIVAPASAGQVLAFAPLPDGGLVIATGAAEQYGETSLVGAVASLLGLVGKKPQQPPSQQLIWLDASGAPLRSAPLPFSCKGVTVAPDGAIVAVGDDRVVVFSAAGEQVAEAKAPHFQPTEEEQAALAEEIAEQHREQTEMRREQLARYVQAKADLEAIPADERTPRQALELAQATAAASAFESSVNGDQRTPEAIVAASLADARTIHRVAASREHLFLVAREPVGYGYGVWRCGRDFSSPEKIVGGLRGCCGQMDVQVVGDELVIPENGRHQVAVYGFDGEPRRTFGEASRTDFRQGFGGCCNPMNACPGPDGTMLLSESNGLVKQFAADGTLVEIVGAADVPSGCKNSSIGLSSDGTTLYYFDVQKGRVLVLEKKS